MDFMNSMTRHLEYSMDGNIDIDCKWEETVAAAGAATAETLSKLEVRPNQLWIQKRTLEVISQRNNARKHGQRNIEIQLNKDIRRNARKDRSDWLHCKLASADCAEVRKLRKGSSLRQGRLWNIMAT